MHWLVLMYQKNSERAHDLDRRTMQLAPCRFLPSIPSTGESIRIPQAMLIVSMKTVAAVMT